jgi:hypothetical protein
MWRSFSAAGEKQTKTWYEPRTEYQHERGSTMFDYLLTEEQIKIRDEARDLVKWSPAG